MPNKQSTSSSSIFAVFAISALISLAILRKVDHVNEQIGIVGMLAFIIALVFGIWFLTRLPSVLRGVSAIPPSSRAIILSSVIFLACVVFATPKVYRIQTRTYRRSSAMQKEIRVDVKPIWRTLKVSNAQVSFVGLSYSIMLCELAGSIACGLIIWALGRSNTRKKQNNSMHTNSTNSVRS